MTKFRKRLPIPRTILFDWHGTLVDTQEAMVSAMEEVLPQLEELGLVDRLQDESQCQTLHDVKLVRYIRIFRRLHPSILVERRVSRTEIFNAIFGEDEEAKLIAHRAYNRCYRNYFGKVRPFQEGIREYLMTLRKLGIKTGIATNRSREFLDRELRIVDDGSWPRLFDVVMCADDVTRYKPDPQIIKYALSSLTQFPGPDTWYVGDGYLDMVTARNAGVTGMFYNGGHWDADYLNSIFVPGQVQPARIIGGLEELMDLLEEVQKNHPQSFLKWVHKARPPYHPPPEAPPIHCLPDWHPSVVTLTPPSLILFDWHATLVDTLDAMYHAVDDMLPELRMKGLLDHLVTPEKSKSPEDARLVEYVRDYSQLHPKIKADRKISRTDIFEVLFGEDQEAKQAAHSMFNYHYRKYFGQVLPFEPKIKDMLVALRKLGLTLGVITNRDREFFEHEVSVVDGTGWESLFDTFVCGDDTERRKPHPDQIFKAAGNLGFEVNHSVWYVGDSTTDVIASGQAKVTSVFFNGAQWGQEWLEKIFPGTERYPHRPNVVVNDFSEFWALVLACMNKAS